MVKATFDKDEKLIDDLLHYCHEQGLIGLHEHIQFRLFASNIELRYGDKQEKYAVSNDNEMTKKIEDHFVKAGIKLDVKIIDELARGTKDLYLAMFNTLVFAKMEVRNIKAIIGKIAHATKLPRNLRKELLKALVTSLKNEHAFLRTTQQQINGALTAYKGNTSVTNVFRSALKTEGANFFRRRKQQKGLKKGVKNVKLALKNAELLKKAKVKNIAEAKKLSDDLTKYLKVANANFEETEKSIGLEFQEFGNLLNTVEQQIEDAVKKHELPQSTLVNTRKLLGKIANVVMFKYAESMHKSINQLDTQIKEAEKMLSISLRKLFA